MITVEIELGEEIDNDDRDNLLSAIETALVVELGNAGIMGNRVEARWRE